MTRALSWLLSRAHWFSMRLVANIIRHWFQCDHVMVTVERNPPRVTVSIY